MWKRDESAALSLPRSKHVRGYTVRRLPLGALIGALEALRELPSELPALLELGRMPDKRTAARQIGRLLGVAPRAIVKATAALIETDEQRLLDDPLLGADGLCELLLAWMQLNSVENFGKAAGRLIRQAKALAAGAGCNGSSPAA